MERSWKRLKNGEESKVTGGKKEAEEEEVKSETESRARRKGKEEMEGEEGLVKGNEKAEERVSDGVRIKEKL